MNKFSPATQEAFPVTGRNRVKRAHKRASYDHKAVYKVLDASMLCHIAYTIDGQPYATPTIHWREGDWLYWHGSSASRMLKNQSENIPVCLTVAMLDGLVMARTGFHHSANYRSAMCFGNARLIQDTDHKRNALLAMIDRYFPGRNNALRPFSSKELKATKVIGMPIEDAVCKIRNEGVIDDDEDLDIPVWAGVIPVSTIIGKMEPCPQSIDGAKKAGIKPYQQGECLDKVFTMLQSA